MAKPLTQKQLKAMLEKAQAALENTKKTLASVEETQFTETRKAPQVQAPSRLAATESGAIGAASISSQQIVADAAAACSPFR
jgi:YesN/AraC family two-component response regulator